MEETPLAVLRAGWTTRLWVPLALVLLGGAGALVVEGAGERAAAIGFLAVPVAAALLVAAVAWARRAVITREGLAVRGLFGTRRVAFADLEQFDYDARRYRLYLFIPLGRVARLRLRGPRGTVVFHAGFRRFDEQLPRLVDLAVAALLPKLRAAIDRGERVAFGRRLSVGATDLTVRGRVFGETKVPVEAVRFDVENGTFRLSSPEGPLGVFETARTSNLLAMPQLLEELSVNRGRARPSSLLEALRRR